MYSYILVFSNMYPLLHFSVDLLQPVCSNVLSTWHFSGWQYMKCNMLCLHHWAMWESDNAGAHLRDRELSLYNRKCPNRALHVQSMPIVYAFSCGPPRQTEVEWAIGGGLIILFGEKYKNCQYWTPFKNASCLAVVLILLLQYFLWVSDLESAEAIE